MVYSKAAVTPVNHWFTHVNHCITKKNLKERCYLHSVQQSYEKNSYKPGIKYFTSVNCQFTLVNHHFTLVNCHFTVICWFTLVNHHFTVICQFTVIRKFMKDHFAEDSNFFLVYLLDYITLSAISKCGDWKKKLNLSPK